MATARDGTAPTRPAGNAGLGTGAHTGAIAGLVLACGATLPAAGGLAWTAIAAIVALSLAAARLRARGSWGWPALLAPRGTGGKLALVGATVFATIVLLAVLARVVAQLVIAFPGAVPAVLFVIVLAVLRPASLGRARWLLAPALVLLALRGATCEAEGEDARGAMHSGAIHGIHPFQATAIIVDGYGPHDLPFNDYVEPIGDRGYDPTELAAAIELALDRIAEVHYADGPLRARQAFLDATAGAVQTAPIQERLDREPAAEQQWRFWVRSGTTGQRSRVEFVCPGRRDDPRGPQPETVMNRMCPDKYANEASAGLSVTGRWPGYVEIRGNERMGLSQLFGWTRSDDAHGVATVELESWLVVVIVVVLVGITVLRERGAPVLATAAMPLALPLGVLVLAAALTTSDLAALPSFVDAPAWADPWRPLPWLAALAWPAFAALSSWVAPKGGGHTEGSGLWLFAAVALAWFASTDLAAAHWLAPAWQLHGPTAAIEPWVIGLADAAARSLPASITPPILALEAVVAAAIAAPVVVAAVHVVSAAAAAAEAAAPERPPASTRRLATLVVVLVAVALAWSRKTDGGVALIPAAIGVALACGSAMQRFAQRGPWPRAHVSTLVIATHVGWTALALWLVAGTAPEGGDPLRWLYTGLAAVAALVPMACCIGDPEPVREA